jgi:RNA-directed DNA polymerase
LTGEPGRSKGVRRVRASGGGSSTAGKPAASAVSDWYIVLTRGTVEEASELKEEIARFLSDELHLELSAEKTLITPVTKGMDFLGFHIRKYKRSNQTLITPSKTAQVRFREMVKQRVWEGFNNGDAAGVVTVNRYIIGWGQYYRRVSSTRVFKTLDHYIWLRVWKTTRRLRMPGQQRSRYAHYKNHYIRYRFDLNKKNRWRQGGHYGAWADEARTRAYIVVKLGFLPIKYVNLHPQLNPYVPEERTKLDMLRGLQDLFADLAKNDPKVNEDYEPEWGEARYEVLTDAGFICERCGRPIYGRTAHVHQKIPLQQSKTRRQANLLENLTALCPTCHKRVERDTQGR